MKHYKVIILLAFVCLFAGCSSLGNPKNLSPFTPVGIVSVISNGEINWDGEGPTIPPGETVGGKLFNAVSNRPDSGRVWISNSGDLISEADASIRIILSQAGIGGFADKDRITASGAYTGAAEYARLGREKKVHAQGYKFLNPRDKNLPARLFQETGIKSVMYITFTFSKVMGSGIGKFGNMRAKVDMLVTIISAEGKTLYNRTHTKTSEDKIAVSNGGYSQDELMNLFRSTIADACYDFISFFATVPGGGNN